MNNESLKRIVKDQFEYCTDLLMEKGKEYAEDEHDRLEHFKAAAAIMGTTPRAALMGMLSKHLVSVSDMCMSGNHYDWERWREKLTDSINYLVLLAALVIEENLDGKDYDPPDPPEEWEETITAVGGISGEVIDALRKALTDSDETDIVLHVIKEVHTDETYRDRDPERD